MITSSTAIAPQKRDVLFRDKMRGFRERYAAIKKRLQNTEQVEVAFMVIHGSIWKYHRVYKLMEADPRFNPTVVVCPFLGEGTDRMIEEMNNTYSLMQDKGYKVLKTYQEQDDRWLNVKEELRPDIVFFSVPYDYTKDRYRLQHFTDSLTCYVPYFFTTNGKKGSNYDGPFHNLVWRSFYETAIHKKYAVKYARNNGDNVVVTGYPRLDDFLYAKGDELSDPWKIKDPALKRIIWAPHHTIDGQGQGLNYSTFKKYHQLFREMAGARSDRVQVAFKPHPMLKQKLYNDREWGRERTDSYYRFWDDLENGMLEESDYTDLFLTSDALIHDCSSFMAEYLSTRKPALYLLHDRDVADRLHEFGKMALEQHYRADRAGHIIKFIDKQVLAEKDPMRDERISFVKTHLKAPNGKPAAENILRHIKSEIGF